MCLTELLKGIGAIILVLGVFGAIIATFVGACELVMWLWSDVKYGKLILFSIPFIVIGILLLTGVVIWC